MYIDRRFVFLILLTVEGSWSTLLQSTGPEYMLSGRGQSLSRPDFRTRVRRASDPEDGWKEESDDEIENLYKLPNDVENETDLQYYSMQLFSGRPEEAKKWWVDVEELLKRVGVQGDISHPKLSKSYRRAVAAKLSFDFPFYGHRMNNLTIATGGFCYIGDESHSWLAATQYIAPLMANFDTHLDGSNILYADDGERFIVEWRRVQLREQKEEGAFTFQAILYKNGNMTFVYKEVPASPANISDAHHPCKLGISDAYLLHHSILGHLSQSVTKRVIYEYHRVEIPAESVVSNTVVLLSAQPTCIFFSTCDDCSNATLKHFNCSWCHAKKKHNGPFCSDQYGLNRRRQQWIENNCRDKSKHTYCHENDFEEVEDDYEDVEKAPTATPLSEFVDGLPLPQGARGNGYALLALVLAVGVTLVGWIAYAYYNPHTTSGQMLIKYRPSRWHVPSSHVRYSASVHM